MMDVTMANPLEKLKKLRSLDEVITRGGQAISVFREQRAAKFHEPADEDFKRRFDRDAFGDVPIIAETVWRRFFDNSTEHFFRTFREPDASAYEFRRRFGQDKCDRFIHAAESIAAGRIDLMGLKNVYVGTEIDWHREPVSSKRSPLKHWKKFDDLDTSETGNKKIIWELNRHQHFFTLGVAYWLTGDERFAETFVRHLESWMDDNPPGLGINWSSSLEVAFRSMSWLWAFHFFRDSDAFSPAIFHRAVKFLYLHGRHIERYLSTYYSPNTHLTGEALALYYLGTQLPFLARAEGWRKTGEDILFAEIGRQVHTDGVYFEQSTWYQRYTADFFAHFVILRSLWAPGAGHPQAQELEDRMEQTFDFLMQVTLPDGTTPLIGDDDGGRMLPLTTASSNDFRGTLAVGAVIFDRGDHKFAASNATEEAFWLMGPDGVRFFDCIDAIEPSSGSTDLPTGGYCVMRDGWTETDNVMVIDCGELGSLAGGHGHADSLSIEVAMNGRTLLVDSGTYTYHESRELRDYFRSTAAHNTLEVDGLSSSEPGNAFGWKHRAESKVENWISTERFDFFTGSHNGYERIHDPVTHRRSVLFLKGDYWIVCDVADAKADHSYALNFHFDDAFRSEIGDGGKWVGGADHRLFTFGDNGRWETKESWISKNHGNRTNAPFMRFVSEGSGKQEFFTFLMPSVPGNEPPSVEEVAMAAGRAFVIRYSGYMDVFVVNDEVGTVVENGIFDSDFRYSWARLRDENGAPDEMVLIDGSNVSLEGNSVIASPTRFASVLRLGKDIYVREGDERRVVELKPVERRKGDRRQGGSDRRRPRQ